MRNRTDRTAGGWRQYQRHLQRNRVARRFRGRLAGALLLGAAGVLAAAGLWSLIGGPSAGPGKAAAPVQERPDAWARVDLKEAISAADLFNLREPGFEVGFGQQPHHVETSLSPPLQQKLMDRLDRRNSRYVGVVAMEPDTGRVLALVGYDKTGADSNPCIEKRFPAASVFKIVTAAAAIQELGLVADSQLTYNGRKHTLYKSQLRTAQNRYTNRTTLRKSFAQSINPVFGKIGTNRLGRDLLARYAEAFGFNRRIGFDVPVPESTFHITDEPYYWAELASGFNRDTRISPLHGAMIAAVVLNGGTLVEPSIVDRVTDASGRVVYDARTAAVGKAVSPEACRQLVDLMQATIDGGTLRKTFRGADRDWVLSKLDIGGKTGSINSRDNDARYDWFVGFARERGGTVQMAVSVVVAHEKYIGVRAGEYARLAIRQYFQETFARRSADRRDASG